MAIVLSVSSGAGPARQVDFSQAKVTIGSDPLCDIFVPDDGVDKQQALLIRRGRGIELFDIGETSGVLVNGSPQRHVRVRAGDEIWIGGTALSLVEGDESAVEFTESPTTVQAAVPSAHAPEGPSAPSPSAETSLGLLRDVGALVNSIASDDNTFEAILDTLFSAVPVRRGFIALLDADGGLVVKAHRNREENAVPGPIEVSRTLVGQVLETGNAVLTSDAEADPTLGQSASIMKLRIKAAICVPLLSAGRVIGVLYGDNRELPGALTRQHLTILSALASVAGAAVETEQLLAESDAKRKIEQALSIARSIQRRFLPDSAPDVEWLDICGRSDSCDETGGDYYDFFPLDDDGLGVVIADVAGHGVGSALLMASVRAALRALRLQKPSLEDLLFQLNNLIREDVHDGRFITLFVGRFDERRRVFEHIGAGHTPPIHLRSGSGATTLVRSAGPPLGIMSDARFERGAPIQLEKGDVVLFTTDGIMEADNIDGAQFGLERLETMLRGGRYAGAEELVEAVIDAVDQFVDGAPLRDDATLVAVRVR
ncbi:MAG: SpoIIE family protein phosphatase [Planctomycetota bacterium]